VKREETQRQVGNQNLTYRDMNSTRQMKMVAKFEAKPIMMVARLVIRTAHESIFFGDRDLGTTIFAPIENDK
jgi:hypothetical protein